MTRQRRFQALLGPVFDDLYRFARRLERDDARAEDLLQAALTAGWSHLDQLADDRAYKVWQTRIVLRTWQNHRRRRDDDVRDPVELDNVIPLAPRGPQEEAYERAEVASAVTSAIDALPEAQREAVTLVDVMGLGFAEAAEVLGVPWGTAASRVARARSALREVLVDVARDQGVIR